MNKFTLINQAEAAVKDALESGAGTDAKRHLECALAHIREAWIAEDGQNARSVEQLQNDLRFGLDMIDRVSQAKPGDVIEIGGRRWRRSA